jgi:hypothetical protein
VSRFGVRVTYADGSEGWVCRGVSDKRQVYTSRRAAQEAADIFASGFDEDEIQAIVVAAIDGSSEKASE